MSGILASVPTFVFSVSVSVFIIPLFIWKINNADILFSGSGLFVASKYAIEAADFQTFVCRRGYARLFSYGVLCLKVKIT